MRVVVSIEKVHDDAANCVDRRVARRIQKHLDFAVSSRGDSEDP
jgi:hypothetical protein